MSYLLDANDNYVLDENGNKIPVIVESIEEDDWYKHKEPIYVNGEILDTENREIKIKDATDDQNAVSLRQLENAITSIISNIKNQIAIDTKALET